MCRLLKIIFVFHLLLWANPAVEAVEVRYAFKKGATYEYEFSRQDSSRFNAFKVNSSQKREKMSALFSIKVIDFQEDAFILDIGSKSGTYRRYLRQNGEIKGAPGETGQNIPFFLTFPDKDWKPGEKQQLQKDMSFGGRSVPVTWTMILKSHDSEKNTAEILFAASMKLPDDQTRQKEFTLKGRAIFNLAEGVLHQAEWSSSYRFIFANKEMAVTRTIWDFEKQSFCSLLMKGLKE